MKRDRNASTIGLLLTLVFFAFGNSAYSTEVRLAWDPNTETNLSGYKLYYKTGSPGAPYNGTGLAQGSSPLTIPKASLTDPSNPRFLLTGLVGNTAYYFALTAYNTAGLDSVYSNEVTYEPVATYSIVASAGYRGSISPSGTVAVNHGGSHTFAIFPEENYQVLSVLVDETSVGSVDNYTFSDVTADHSIEVTFALRQVQLPNQPPTASNQTVTVQEDSSAGITLRANDSNNDPLTYMVTSQPAHGALTGALPNLTYTPAPNYFGPDSFTFKANDGLADSNITIVTITVTPVNDAPVANAGSGQTVSEGNPVILNGAASHDPDGDPLSYHWTLYSGTMVSLSAAQSANPVFVAPEVGPDGDSLVFRLTVTDSGGLQSLDECMVHVRFKNDPPVADAGPDQTVAEGAMVTLNGSSSTDPDDGITAYLWEQVTGNPVTLRDAQTKSASFMTPDVGPSGESLTFKLTVTDEGGLQSQDTCIFNVTWQNEPPVADTGEDQSVPERSMVVLDGSISSDPDEGALSYRWEQISGIPVTMANPESERPSFIAPDVNSTGASLVFQLTVTDDGGLQAQDTCIVSVTWENQPPVADAGTDQAVDSGDVVTLNGSGSRDTDDGIASYRWTQLLGIPVTLSDPEAVGPSFTAPNADSTGESLIFQLTVTDNGGLQNADTCMVTADSTSDRASTLSVSNLWVASGRPYEVVQDALANQNPSYIDKRNVYRNVPVWMQGATYIETAYADSLSMGNSFLSFDVNLDVTVYVAHDDSIRTKPAWMSGFVDTRTNLRTDRVLSIYKKNFPAGRITLGGNVSPFDGKAHSMYTVIIEER